MHPLDLVDAAPWRETVFTTYALSLSFFEAVVLDRLVRGGGRNSLILSDPEGVRAGLSEQGARRVGRDYELEPIACSTGVFHAKVSAFFGENDCHLLVGSGNLTFGGWGNNLEIFDHLHPSFAGDAFLDAAGFFDALTVSDQVRHGVASRLEAIGSNLRLAARTGTSTGAVRFLHSLETPISEQLADLADGLGGATRLVVISPFFDRLGLGLKSLSSKLSCDDIHLHVHPAGPVRGSAGINWPAGGIGKPIRVVGEYSDDPRLLHAKCFEITCRNGRLIVSGSVNATRAALDKGNIEAAVVRIQPNASAFWTLQPASPPTEVDRDETEEEDEDKAKVGILRASLEEGRIVGMVFTDRLSGQTAQATISTIAGELALGEAIVQPDGQFDFAAPEIESESWSSGRFVLRLTAGAAIAEGFITLAAAREIIRRAGSMAPKIMALLSAMETPGDVAAILSWFAESPDRLLPSEIASRGSGSDKSEKVAVWVSEGELAPDPTKFTSQEHGKMSAPQAAWSRALDMIMAAFAKPRGAWTQGTERDDHSEDESEKESPDQAQKRLEDAERQKRKAVEAFHLLLEKMLSSEQAGSHSLLAFTIGHYLVDRNRPAVESVRPWLQRILNSFTHFDPTEHAAPILTALLLRATDRHDSRPLKARRFLLRRGINPSSVELALDQIPGFIETFSPNGWDAQGFVEAINQTRTAGEEIRAYLKLPFGTLGLAACPNLAQSPYANRLREGLASEEARARWVIFEERPSACPRCHMTLNGKAVDELDEFGITTCCRTILCKEF